MIYADNRKAQFLSTLPARGATLSLALHDVVGFMISIHAPREGSDEDL